MLLLFESTTSCANVLAWLTDAPPKTVPFGNVIVWGFCSSGCCTMNCCGWPAHPARINVATAATTEGFLFLILFFIRSPSQRGEGRGSGVEGKPLRPGHSTLAPRHFFTSS